MRVGTFMTSASTTYNTAVVDGFTDPYFTSTPLTVNNVNLEFSFSQLPFAVTQVTFEYTESGGVQNLGVNGSVVLLSRMGLAPATLGGATVTVVESQFANGMRGTVTIQGALTSVTVGGQEFGLDNVEAVPAPATLALSGLAALCAARRRRDLLHRQSIAKA